MAEENIDKIFSERLGDRHFEPDPKAWEAFEQLQGNKQPEGAFWASVSRLSLLLLGLLFITGLYRDQSYHSFGIATAETSNNALVELQANQRNEPEINVIHGLESGAERLVTTREEELNKTIDVQPEPKEVFSQGVSLQEKITDTNEPGSILEQSEQKRVDKISENKPTIAANDFGQGADKALSFNEASSNSIAGTHQDRSSKEELIALGLEIDEENLSQILHPNYSPGLSLNSLRSDLIRRGSLRLLLGLSHSPALSGTNSGNGNSSLNYYLGAEYAYRLNQRWSLSLGAQYAERGGLNSQWQQSSTSFDFGFEKTLQVYSPVKLSYLELPLMAQYHISSRHSFGAGLGLGVLLNVERRFGTSIEDDFGLRILENEVQNGYQSGFELIDIPLMLRYEYALTRRAGIGLALRYGLTDITIDQFYGNQIYDQNIQLRAGVYVNLIGSDER